MVIGLLSIAAIPTVTGVSLGVSEQRKRNTQANDERRMAKFNIDVFCAGQSPTAKSLNGRRVVVRDGKIYIEHNHPSIRKHSAHTVEAFYIAYPDESQKRGDGLVTTVSDNPPMLNWIYVDTRTLELRCGNRTQSVEHIVGHWDWDQEDEVGVTLEGEELFSAVEQQDGSWALYFDRNGDGLQGYVDPNSKVIEISLDRRLVDSNNSDGNS